ncbi:hypothetical protein quinque_016391, partial [Culex quinquefasciatus]
MRRSSTGGLNGLLRLALAALVLVVALTVEAAGSSSLTMTGGVHSGGGKCSEIRCMNGAAAATDLSLSGRLAGLGV